MQQVPRLDYLHERDNVVPLLGLLTLIWIVNRKVAIVHEQDWSVLNGVSRMNLENLEVITVSYFYVRMEKLIEEGNKTVVIP